MAADNRCKKRPGASDTGRGCSYRHFETTGRRTGGGKPRLRPEQPRIAGQYGPSIGGRHHARFWGWDDPSGSAGRVVPLRGRGRQDSEGRQPDAAARRVLLAVARRHFPRGKAAPDTLPANCRRLRPAPFARGRPDVRQEVGTRSAVSARRVATERRGPGVNAEGQWRGKIVSRRGRRTEPERSKLRSTTRAASRTSGSRSIVRTIQST